MGIYDRDYIRRDEAPRGVPGRSARGGIRMWSVNTWIIVICVAVFIIDGFLPTQLVHMGSHPAEGIPVIPASAEAIPGQFDLKQPFGQPEVYPSVQTIRILEGGQAVERDMLVLPLFDQRGGAFIGWVRVQPMKPIERFMHYSTGRGFLKFEFWRFIGFQFLHDRTMLAHLLFNMIGLYFFGPLVEQYLGRKRYLAFYLLSGMCGALFYSLLNLAGYVALQAGIGGFPGLLFYSPYTPLIGASAGVFGVLMAGAYLAPRATVLLFFILPMQLRTVAYALVAIAAATVIFGGTNAGGEAGHLGGAIAGFYFIRHPKHLHGFFDILGRVDPTSHHYRGKRSTKPGQPSRTEIDRILEKVHRDGIKSLTEKEKRLLQQASKE